MVNEIHLRFKPKQSLGQNFLTDDNIAKKIVRELQLNKNDFIIEIGPGYGALTKFLIGKVKYFIAVELDKRFVKELSGQFQSNTFEIIQQDFIDVSLKKLKDKFKTKLRIVGNIPYHLTSSIIFKVLDERESIEDITIMVQREVAQRIIAKPSTKNYGTLSVFSQFYGIPKILFDVSPTCFYPIPKVISSIIKIKIREKLQFNINDDLFKLVVKTAFSKRRKTLRNSLKYLPVEKEIMDLIIENIDFNLGKRPEQLAVEEFVYLTKEIGKYLDY